MKKIVKLSRCFNRNVSREIVLEKKDTPISLRRRAHLDKIERDEEKRLEMEKHEAELKLEKKREKLCKNLLDRIEKRTLKEIREQPEIELDNPKVPYSEIGKFWIFEFDKDHNRIGLRRLKGNDMKFTGEELLQACSQAIEAILSEPSDVLNATRIHQAFQREIAELPDDEVQRNIELSSVLAKFFNTQKIALEGLSSERKSIESGIRENRLTLNVPTEKKAKIVDTTSKLDKKFGKQISTGLAGKELSKDDKWKVGKLKTDYADLANLDFERIEDLNKK